MLSKKEAIINIKFKKNSSLDNKCSGFYYDGKNHSLPVKRFEFTEDMNGKDCIIYYVDEIHNIEEIEIEGKKVKKKVEKREKKKYKNTMNLRVPVDTCMVIHLNSCKLISNFHLKLNRFATYNTNDGYKLDGQDIKKDFFKKNWETYEEIIKSHDDAISTLFEGKNIINFKFQTFSRLLIGSEESIYETSIRLHHIYGFPYIPASAIKGVFRRYIINEKYQGNEDKALCCEDFIKVFGSQDKEGKFVFFDAFPQNNPTLKIDVLTPHYKDYYDGDSAPTDTQDPVPVKFLTIEKTIFNFIIGYYTEEKEKHEEEKKYCLNIEANFKACLEDFGIGAKTAVGYGYFCEKVN